MREYISHKRVKAARIASVRELAQLPGAKPVDAAPVWLLTFNEENLAEAVIKGSIFARGVASPGDYIVMYEDGYVSWSPAKAFEDGYSPAP